MEFDREKAFSMRLNIPAGTAVRFEPGEEKEIELVEVGGNKKIYGFNNLVDGDINEMNKKQAIQQGLQKISKTKKHEPDYKQNQIRQHVWPNDWR
jgi:hypothetical protein